MLLHTLQHVRAEPGYTCFIIYCSPSPAAPTLAHAAPDHLATCKEGLIPGPCSGLACRLFCTCSQGAPIKIESQPESQPGLSSRTLS